MELPVSHTLFPISMMQRKKLPTQMTKIINEKRPTTTIRHIIHNDN